MTAFSAPLAPVPAPVAALAPVPAYSTPSSPTLSYARPTLPTKPSLAVWKALGSYVSRS